MVTCFWSKALSDNSNPENLYGLFCSAPALLSPASAIIMIDGIARSYRADAEMLGYLARVRKLLLEDLSAVGDRLFVADPVERQTGPGTRQDAGAAEMAAASVD
jgi:hypothetical protein